jgi:hypothetical protein
MLCAILAATEIKALGKLSRGFKHACNMDLEVYQLIQCTCNDRNLHHMLCFDRGGSGGEKSSRLSIKVGTTRITWKHMRP